ncbi:MAG: hypothetical protein MUF18_15970, partial [Fimbriiglobus sp.]|nr:hypothetical protein [Fimbriiglobus sp.]
AVPREGPDGGFTRPLTGHGSTPEVPHVHCSAWPVALATSGPKATAPELKWKFAEGDTFSVTMQLDTDAIIQNGPVLVAP